MPHADPDKRREYNTEHHRKCRAARSPHERQVYLDRAKTYEKKRDHTKRRGESKKRRDKARLDILAHYGGKCACCGESNSAFLEIDHVNNDGKEHRKKLIPAGGGRVAGSLFFMRLRTLGYPDDYALQVLCANCHIAKTREGACVYH
jgi:hypothetical protein